MWLALPALAGYVAWLTRRFQWPGEATPLFVVSSIIAVLYVAGLVNLLAPVAWALVACGWILAAWEVRRRGGRGIVAARPSAGTVAFFAVVAVAAVWLDGARFIGWDEFSHWGLVTRDLVQTGTFIAKESPVLFRDYPPGSALFHYFWMRGGGFAEDAAYVAHAVIAIAAVSALTTGRRIAGTLAAHAFGYAALWTFSSGSQSLLVDPLVALLFGCGAGAYFLASDTGRVVRVVPVLVALPLLKSVGLMLALFFAFMVANDVVLRLRPWRRTLAVVVVLIALPLVTSSSWRAHVERLDAPETLPVRARSTQEILRAFSNEASPVQRQTRERFAAALATETVGANEMGVHAVMANYGLVTYRNGGLSAREWAVAYAIVLLLIGVGIADQRDRLRFVISQAWLAICACAYVAGLLGLYLFAFTENEGPSLAGMGRYLGILGLGAACVLFAWGLRTAGASARGLLAAAACAVMVAGFGYTMSADGIRFAQYGGVGETEDRRRVWAVLDPLVGRLDPSSRVYLIWEGTNGLEFFTSRYELAPRLSNRACWSLGQSRYEGDLWTCGGDAATWRQQLAQGFDHVLLAHVDDRFWTEFGALFDTPGGRLYRVGREGRLELVAIGDALADPDRRPQPAQ